MFCCITTTLLFYVYHCCGSRNLAGPCHCARALRQRAGLGAMQLTNVVRPDARGRPACTRWGQGRRPKAAASAPHRVRGDFSGASHTGGGDKGYVLPDNWKETIFEGLGFDRAYELYGMSELMSGCPQCEHGNYHISPVVIPFVLDPISGEALPRSGEQTGRFAFLDLLPETFWGGFVSGDEEWEASTSP